MKLIEDVATGKRPNPLLSEILEWEPIPEEKLVYLRERLRDRLYTTIMKAFLRRVELKKDFKQSDLAIRIHRTQAQIARWFSGASNLTIDSISDLLAGVAMDIDDFPITPIEKTVQVESPSTGTRVELKKEPQLPHLPLNPLESSPNHRTTTPSLRNTRPQSLLGYTRLS